MPFSAHQHLHRRSMPVDERDLRASLPQDELSGLVRCTSYSPGEAHRESWASDSSDSVISSGSDSDGSLYKVILLGEHGVGKTSLARIFGGVEDGAEAEEAGEGAGSAGPPARRGTGGGGRPGAGWRRFNERCLPSRKHVRQIDYGRWRRSVSRGVRYLGTGTCSSKILFLYGPVGGLLQKCVAMQRLCLAIYCQTGNIERVKNRNSCCLYSPLQLFSRS